MAHFNIDNIQTFTRNALSQVLNRFAKVALRGSGKVLTHTFDFTSDGLLFEGKIEFDPKAQTIYVVLSAGDETIFERTVWDTHFVANRTADTMWACVLLHIEELQPFVDYEDAGVWQWNADSTHTAALINGR